MGLLILVPAPSQFAADLPETTVGAGMGVNIHFTRGNTQDLDKIQAAGFKFIRMDFGWAGIEHKKGEYDWSAYDELTANLDQRGIRAYYILDYSHPLYEESVVSRNPITGQEQRDVGSPKHPESVAAYAAWAAAAARHFAGRRVIWEIWNEPNIDFWKPKPDARDYASLVLAAAKAIRAADPQATIVGPASSSFPWKFIETVFAAGALEYLDAVSVHPYREAPPETAARDYEKLRALIARYASAGKANLPILSGEWGYPSTRKGISLEKQAAYLVRQQLANLLNGVPISIWYDWKNDGPDPDNGEHNFGTVTGDLQPKPGYQAAQTLVAELPGYRLARRLVTDSKDDYALLAVGSAGEQKLVIWTLGPAHEVSVKCGRIQPESIRAVGICGETASAAFVTDQVTVKAESGPVYVTLGKPVEFYSAAAAWSALLPEGASVRAGVPVRVKVANPFARTVRVEVLAGLSDLGKPVIRRFQLAAHAAREESFKLIFSRRDFENGSVSLATTFFEEAGSRMIGSSSESLPFTLAAPLYLVVAPTGSGRRLMIQNPSGEPFAGKVQFGGKAIQVMLKVGDRDTSLELMGASNDGTGVRLLDPQGMVLSEPAKETFSPLNALDWRAELDGDSKIPAQASIQRTNSPGEKAPFAESFRLDYEFGDGWRFVRCVPSTALPAIQGQPKALGVWVYANNQGQSLRVRLRDSAGQTFQFSGANCDWKGWRWVTIELREAVKSAAHWGGADDGVIHGDLAWDTPLLLDGTRHKTSGTIYFAGLTLIYP